MHAPKKHSGKISSSTSTRQTKNNYPTNSGEIENSSNITAAVMTFGRGNTNVSSHHSLPVR